MIPHSDTERAAILLSAMGGQVPSAAWQQLSELEAGRVAAAADILRRLDKDIVSEVSRTVLRGSPELATKIFHLIPCPDSNL